MAPKVKICGITRVEDADLACSLGADFIGVNFYRPSPRSVTVARACEIRDVVARRAPLVGVFVNASRAEIETALREVRLDFIQFHGDENREAVGGWPVPTIRAVRLRPGEDPPPSESLGTDFILLDCFNAGLYGGTGNPLRLERLAEFDLRKTFVAGGLNVSTVAKAAALGPYAVDVASGVESSPGIKDHQKLRSFIGNAKSA